MKDYLTNNKKINVKLLRFQLKIYHKWIYLYFTNL